MPLGYWAVTRYDGGRQLYLEVRDDAYGLAAGDSHPWADSLCVRMLAGAGPSIAPDAMAIPAYSSAGVAEEVPIGAYVGVPLRRSDGTLFGTICGLDPHRQAVELTDHEPLIQVLSRLLGLVLDADLAQVEAAARLRRFGDPTSVVVTDLDGLKQVNDEHGHAAGNRHLVLASRITPEEADAAMYRDKARRRDTA